MTGTMPATKAKKSAANRAADDLPVLVVGATGNLGGRVVDHLLSRGKRVRALVRSGTDASRLEAKGVEVVRADLTDRATLDAPVSGVSAVVTTAAGYTGRRRGDSLETVDHQGNLNLVDAAAKARVPRFVFTSILNCDQAPDVPHFWTKKLIEDELEARAVPFVALRPGAFIVPPGSGWDLWSKGLKKGRLRSFGPRDVPWTWIPIDEVARALSLAVDAPGVEGKRIDLGTDRAVSMDKMAADFARILGRPVKTVGMGPMGAVMGAMAIVSSRMRDMKAMVDFFGTGKYVADTTQQARLLGPVPKLDDALRDYVRAAGLA
ncbi:MAG: hypothetical protein QOJ26_1456 [Thermoplasmata archaeon]|nr:hypothetical protein [Thermoplasmata archaeon]